MTEDMTELRACPVCGAADIVHWFTGFTNRDPADKATWPVAQCQACTHGFMNPQPGPHVLGRYYTAEYAPYAERHGAEADDEHIVAEARATGEFRHAPITAGKRVLDLGCGGGWFLNICRKLGADVFGIEPSQHGYDITASQNIPVFRGDLASYLASHGGTQFDVITSSHVFEHIPDPVAALRGLRELLAPGGVVVISVPNARSRCAQALRQTWHNTDLPYHLHHFSAQSFAKAAELAGLAVTEMGTTSLPKATLSSAAQMLRRKYYIPTRVAQRLIGLKRAHTMARADDANAVGEALLARFVCAASQKQGNSAATEMIS
jgi:2-polyprenyl-3-methyl-5-hydroxy-6-metoxy-1,4-benzoquinol methylase